MSIPVTCPECDYHFQVADEFAGRPGRCPECSAVIQVPDPAVDDDDAPSDDHLDPYPYQTPRGVEAFQDEPVPFTRRVRHEPDPPLPPIEAAGPTGPTFDRERRAAHWKAVSNGFRNLTIAAVLLALNQVLQTALLFIKGAEAMNDQQMDAGKWGMLVANGLLSILGVAMWAFGRMACGRVPYVPARNIARPAAVIAGLSAGVLAMAMLGILIGVAIAQQNQGGAVLLLLVGVCSFIPALIGIAIAEIMGLASQLRMAEGLGDPGFARASRVQMTFAVLLTAISVFGCCGLALFMTDKQMEQQHAAKQKAAQRKDAERREKGKDAPAKQNQAGAEGEDEEQPPELEDFPEITYAVNAAQALMAMAYAFVSILCWQLGRAAIRRESERLLGDADSGDRERRMDRGWGDY